MAKLDWRPCEKVPGALVVYSRIHEHRSVKLPYVVRQYPGENEWSATLGFLEIARGTLQACLDACEASEAAAADPRCGTCGGSGYVAGEPTVATEDVVVSCRETEAEPCPECGTKAGQRNMLAGAPVTVHFQSRRLAPIPDVEVEISRETAQQLRVDHAYFPAELAALGIPYDGERRLRIRSIRMGDPTRVVFTPIAVLEECSRPQTPPNAPEP